MLALALSTGCTTGAAGAPCIRHSDCAVSLTCGLDGFCAVPPDAPSPDGGIDAVSIPDLADAQEDAAPDATPDARPDAAPDAQATPNADAGIDAF
ncbi:MAG: hypothetical protein K8W52_08050 [Deltaproteobacteria bacterium]|nr:hypothetical protein [Deltaproteobacteria bacterium]